MSIKFWYLDVLLKLNVTNRENVELKITRSFKPERKQNGECAANKFEEVDEHYFRHNFVEIISKATAIMSWNPEKMFTLHITTKCVSEKNYKVTQWGGW